MNLKQAISPNWTIVFSFIFFPVIQASTADSRYVRVSLEDGSPIIGERAKAFTGKPTIQFLGVPFAEPPVGHLRFRKPVPKSAWREPYNATTQPNPCIQSLDTYFGDFYGATMWNSNIPSSEDCLYLNLYVPGRDIDRSRKLPILVWVYGGGFWSGSVSLDVYDGKVLSSEENVIVAAMNYRVSVFGFLYLGRPEAPGNMGLWDQLLAMKWIHTNIEAFGGDPDRITLFGESAGAASVSMHMLSQRSIPYFQRAIVQSGSATAPWAMEKRQVAIRRGVVLYEYMKCGNMTHKPELWDLDEVIRCLLNTTAETLRDSEWAPVMEFADFPWVPVVDGDFLVENTETSFQRGNMKKTQLLAGSNLNEAIYFIVYQLGEVFPPSEFFEKRDFITSRDVWLKSVSNLLPRHMLKSSLALQSIIHEYEPHDYPILSQNWIDSMDKMLGDYLFTCNVNDMALAHSAHGGDTYYYYFTHKATQQTWPSWMGVLHGYEINFIFGEPYNTKRFKYTKEEIELSSRFMRYWANFARTGDPNKNPDGTYTADVWPPYKADSMKYLNLTVESDYAHGAKRIGFGPRRKQCSFWKNIVPSLLSVTANVGESFIGWKQQMDRWENEYIADWQYHFEQYKRYQIYRHMDSDDVC